MKICILGAGSLGSAIGGVLAEAGADVSLVSRSADFVDAVARDGLRLVEAGRERKVRLAATRDPRTVGAVDLVVVLVKSRETGEAIRSAAALLGPATTVLSLQNGLGHEDLLAAAVGPAHVIAGKTYVGGLMTAPGIVTIGVAGKETVIGELAGGTSERIRRIAALFEKAGLATHVSADIMAAMWEKLLVNVATGALSAITGLSYGDLYAVPEIEATALAAVREAMAVAAAAGVRLATTDPSRPWLKAKEGLPPAFKASMLQSVEKGRLTEIDFVNGAVVERGRRTGVPTPVNAALVAAVKGIERRLSNPHT